QELRHRPSVRDRRTRHLYRDQDRRVATGHRMNEAAPEPPPDASARSGVNQGTDTSLRDARTLQFPDHRATSGELVRRAADRFCDKQLAIAGDDRLTFAE